MILIVVQSGVDELFPFVNMSTDVLEVICVLWVAEDIIPGSTLNCLLWHGGCIQNIYHSWVVNLDSIVALGVLILQYDLVSLTKFDASEEVWKVFVD